MKNTGFKTLAARYVSALFDVADDASALDAVADDMAALGVALEESEEFSQFLNNPLLSRENQLQALDAIFAKMKAHKITQQFMRMLVTQKRLPVLSVIIKLFAERVSAARGELDAELVSATPLKDREINIISERLSKAYGKKVNLAVSVNPALLGGVIVKIGSVQMDSSLTGKLNRLGLALKAA